MAFNLWVMALAEAFRRGPLAAPVGGLAGQRLLGSPPGGRLHARALGIRLWLGPELLGVG